MELKFKDITAVKKHSTRSSGETLSVIKISESQKKILARMNPPVSEEHVQKQATRIPNLPGGLLPHWNSAFIIKVRTSIK